MEHFVDKAKLQEFATKLHNKQKTVFAPKAAVGSPLVAATAAAMTDEEKVYVYTGSETGYTSGNWYYYNGSAWVSGGVYNAVAVQTDDTLSVSGMAADAAAVGEALTSDTGSGLTADVKEALFACISHIGAWTDGNGQDYVDALEAALYPPADLVRISAVYTQSGTVYDTDSLDDLKNDLVVTAHYSDGTSAVITTYTLSGTLTVGTSVITVTYGGKTDTFNVTVTHAASDTTAEIDQTGKILVHVTSEPYYKTASKTNGGITVKYQMDTPASVLYPAGIIPTDAISSMTQATSAACLFVYDANDEPINFVNELTTSSFNRWVQNAEGTMTEFSQSWNVTEYSKIAFSVDVRYLDDAYMYDKTTGKVFFAGINTPYYGMSNISEASE